MKITFKKQFLKDFEILPEKLKLTIGDIVFKHIPEIRNIHEIKGIVKIRGSKDFYRLRVADYRIGMHIDKGKIVFHRVLHRKDIYRFFP